MKPSKQRTDVVWGYLAQALNIGAGLLLLPVVLHYLPPGDVGLWFVFIALTGLAQLLEFGFQPTVARNTAYIYAGAQSLTAVGVPTDISQDRRINHELLGGLVAATRAIYRWVALLAVAVLLLGGSLYISTLLTPAQDRTGVLLAWALYAAGNVANFYYGYVNGLLQGRGDVSAANKVVIITRSTMLLMGATALVANFGLVGLGAATLLSCLLGRWVALHFFQGRGRAPEAHAVVSAEYRRQVMKTLWHTASRLGLAQVGAFLIQRANVLLASSFLGLAAAASYSMTVTLLMALGSISAVVLQVRMPRLAAAQADLDRPALRALFGEILVFSWLTFLTGLGVLLFFGDSLLHAISSKTPLLPMPALALLGLVFLLEFNHSVAASYLTTRNHVPFLWAGLLSGVVITALSLALITPFQVWGLIAAQGLVQLAYNNWKWPLEVRRDLGLGWWRLLCLGIRKILHQEAPPPLRMQGVAGKAKE